MRTDMLIMTNLNLIKLIRIKVKRTIYNKLYGVFSPFRKSQYKKQLIKLIEGERKTIKLNCEHEFIISIGKLRPD